MISRTTASFRKALSQLPAEVRRHARRAYRQFKEDSAHPKYHYVFWRPITAIRAGDTDGNSRTDPDPAWSPFITTPCFPSYPSAHASGSYAARTIAEKIFGKGGHDITLSHPGIADVTLHYTKFSQMTDDIDDARVYGGIHFRFDQEAGARQGRRVGSYVYKHTLRCSHDDDQSGDDDHHLFRAGLGPSAWHGSSVGRACDDDD